MGRSADCALMSSPDLGLISGPQARGLAEATLTEVRHLKRFDGFALDHPRAVRLRRRPARLP